MLDRRKTRLVSRLALLALVAAPAALRADPLNDLRFTLQKLRGDTPIKAQIAARSIVKNGDEDEQRQETQEATVLAELGPQGLRLTWSPQLLEEARKAAVQRAANPDAPASRGVRLSIVDAEQAAELLDAADGLRLTLERAVLVEDKMEPRAGKPTRVLVVKPHENLSAAQRKSLKSSEHALKIWLDATGIPVALDRSYKAKFSKLLISFNLASHEAKSFAVVGDHLVATAASEESSGSGLGQSGETRRSARVTVLP
jgi:hypothetical protein